MTLSVVVIAQDEERTIGDVFAAAKPIADEMVLVDSGSSDRTVEIAESLGVKCHHQEWLGYAAQKNLALSLAESDWVLSLDADEVMTEGLVEEIRRLLSSERASEFDGYKIPRILFIGDRPFRHGGFYPDAQLRLVKKGAGEFNDRLVHEAIKMKGPTRVLKNCMHHYAYETVEEFVSALDKYARLSAQEFARKGDFGWRSNPVNEMIHPLWTFWYRFVLKGGIMDGVMGLQLAIKYSDYVRKKIRYLREIEDGGASQGPS